MDSDVKVEGISNNSIPSPQNTPLESTQKQKAKFRGGKDDVTTVKRRCVSTACIACRKRKSKCDGNLPKCAACASVYLTECHYDPNSDHRRKGVYKKDIDNLKTRNSTLQTLIQAILNYDEQDVPELIRQIRTCESLEEVAEGIIAREKGEFEKEQSPDSPVYGNDVPPDMPQFESELAGRMGDMVIEGSVKFVGGTSNLIWLPPGAELDDSSSLAPRVDIYEPSDETILSWTNVTQDKELIVHLINMYFSWHYAYFTTLSKDLFYRDFLRGRNSQYCSPLLVNVMLAVGCHFTSWPAARANPEDSATTGDHFFKEAKRLAWENDEHTKAKLCTVQALALMSVREAGCGREGKGWVYSGMSFRMACDLGLNIDSPGIIGESNLTEEDIDARRITFWGCFLFDKCWSNYLGRQPQLIMSNITAPKFEVYPNEDSETWSPYTDSGAIQAHTQPARTRAVALQTSALCEISSDLLTFFYHPTHIEKPVGKQSELKKLTDLHTRLEAWRKNLPKEMEPKEGQLPHVLLMHMFFQLLFIHLYRPFLKYTRATSPLPAHVSPRKLCTAAATSISKLLRLYKRTHGLHQICNIAVYITHSACTIHLLNLPDKNAKRDIIHGVKHLEEIGECWTCARRTLHILNTSAERWKIELPEDVIVTFKRAEEKFGIWGSKEQADSPQTQGSDIAPMAPAPHMPAQMMVPLSNSSSTSKPHQQLQQQQISLQQIPVSASASMNPLQSSGHFPATTAGESPLPSTPDSRRTSGGLSLPPQSAADFTRLKSRNSASVYLTREQQEAWNRHQANRNVSTSGNQPGDRSNNAAVLFGGVESLVEESQDWWLRDQSALALGFDNWGDGWNGLDLPDIPDSDINVGGGMDGGAVNGASKGGAGGYSFSSNEASGINEFDGGTIPNGYGNFSSFNGSNQSSMQGVTDPGYQDEYYG